MGGRVRSSDRAGRGAVGSVGAPAVRREVRRVFWRLIASGLSTQAAGAGCGVSLPAAAAWFRQAGGMAPLCLDEPSGRYLSFAEREEIALGRAGGASIRAIAARIGRAPSTVSRELRRNAATRSGGFAYRATVAQWHCERRAMRPKPCKLALNEPLHAYVRERLCGKIAAPGPAPKLSTRRPITRGQRPWARGWSPAQIAARLPIEFPDDEAMRISHEAIYQALYVQGRGTLRRELAACLRTGRAQRVPRARAGTRARAFLSPEVMISQRPAEAADRAIPGHWEGDLILGSGSSAIGTLVERSTRYLMLLHLPRPTNPQRAPGSKHPPALSGHDAAAVRDAIAATITTLPAALRRSLTWDQGPEMAQHARLRIDTGLQVYFADPHSPWQRGTNENTNGLLRQYFPKGTDLYQYTPDDLAAVAEALNTRPRKTLHWKTPAEALNEHLLSIQHTGVATTD